jgi:S-adenosylmethionine-diacylgycerolhomoserine-N-methlytransferase
MHSAECLSAGGSLHVVDFGDQSGLPAWFQSGLHRWLRWFDVTPRADLRLAINDVATALNMRGRVASLFRGYAVHAVVERSFR